MKDTPLKKLQKAVKAPDFILPWLDRFYEPFEIQLFSSFQAPRLDLDAETFQKSHGITRESLDRLYQRRVLVLEKNGTLAPGDFHGRYDIWSVFEGFKDIPQEIRKEAEQHGTGDEEFESLEEMYRSMAKRGKQANLGFFAFTATPKHKTLSVFGREKDGKSGQAFHTYTLRQAIEEGFIMDVLHSYTTYATYCKLIQASTEDPQVERKNAAKALARFMRLHPYNIAQKTEIMAEHFNNLTLG